MHFGANVNSMKQSDCEKIDYIGGSLLLLWLAIETTLHLFGESLAF